jgi:alpha-1,2-mannosyltransferase
MRRAFADAEDAWALCLNAFAALLISPISWSHHWVWGEMAVLVLAVRSLRNRHRGGLAAAAAGLVIFAAAPQWWFPSGENRETHWAAWQQILGDSYVSYAVVILLLSVRPGRRAAPEVPLESTAVVAAVVGDQVGVVDARAG